ncbi:hypothetical protein [Cetobacterium sp.]|uniref:hypothetical protein n=1 Tax=Cetobacterium sp. TaxID=2071632 RepID=UPI003F37C892
MGINPLSNFVESEEETVILEGQDIFFLTGCKAEKYVYVEDRNCAGLYEILFEKIYPGKEIKVFDYFDGKANIIKRYKELENAKILNSKIIFLLDRDYENKFENRNYRTLHGDTFKSLKLNPNFRIWEKTNIENYLLENKDTVNKAFRCASFKGIEKFQNLLTEDKYVLIQAIFKELSLNYMVSHLFEGKFKKIPLSHIKIPCCSFEKEYTYMLEILRVHVNQNKNNYYQEIVDIENKDFDKIVEEFRASFNEETDIDGKQMLKWIVKFIKDESKKICENGEKDCSSISEDTIKAFMLTLLSEEQLSRIKSELRLI